MTIELITESSETELALSQVESTLCGQAHTLDLTVVRSALAGALQEIALGADALAELATLREDLAARIRGMQSAIAVAIDSSDNRSADTHEELSVLKAADLTKRYLTTCARFRDTFPGRFTYLGAGDVSRRKYDWTDYQT